MGDSRSRIRKRPGPGNLGLEVRNLEAECAEVKIRTRRGAPKRHRVYEDRGGGVIMSTHTTITAQGQEALTIYAAKFDGKDYLVVTRGSGVVSSISFRVIDAYSESFTLTRDGKVAVQGVTTVAKNGGTLTMTLNTTNAQGQPFHGVSIYEKQ